MTWASPIPRRSPSAPWIGAGRLYAHKRIRGEPLKRCHTSTPVAEVWESLRKLQEHQISHGDLRDKEITVSNGAVFFGGFGSAEYGATDNQLQADIAQLLVTTTALYGADEAVAAAIEVLGPRHRADRVPPAHQNRCAETYPGLGRSMPNPSSPEAAPRSCAKPARRRSNPNRSPGSAAASLSSWCCSVALVYVAYPFISTVPTFFNALTHANWWWALLGLAISASTYVGAAAALWASADESVNFWRLSVAQVANTFRRDHHPGRRRRARAEHPHPAEERAQHDARHHRRRAAAVDAGDHAHRVADLLQHRRGRGNRPVPLRSEVDGAVPDCRCRRWALSGVFLLVPNLRRWLSTSVTPKLKEIITDIIEVAREPKRMGVDRLGLHRNDSRRGAGVVVQRRGVRRSRDVRHRHRGDDGRRHPGLGRAHSRRRRRRRSGPDRWARRVRRARRPSASRRCCCIGS